jgi:hypothetical protein
MNYDPSSDLIDLLTNLIEEETTRITKYIHDIRISKSGRNL